jgi:NitT/TauT family transport system substrate-binding protein
MDRRQFLGTAAAASAALVAKPHIARAAKHELLVAEPVHSTGYLPMYIAMAKDYFAEADINVKIVTIETGAGHTNAVLSGQAFAFIGGPEHNAFAKAKGAELRAVVHCVDRGNVYFCAEKGLEPKGRDFTSFIKGKAIATGGFGGTPNSITRFLIKKWGLDAKTDVTVVETANSAILAAVRGKRAQIGCSTEPFITQGVKNNVWSEPFFNVPKELGPYAYSTINIRLDSIQKEPEVVRGFVRGMVKGLKFLYANKDESAEVAKKQFPTMPLDDLKATLDRSFADEMWSKDGMITRAAWDTGKSVVMEAGILKTDVKYDEIIDMSFVESVKS